MRGFDFDYVGLLWFSDLKWRSDRWVVDVKHVHERGIGRRRKAARSERNIDGPAHQQLLRAVAEAYRIILTRPIKGLYIWCEDEETRDHLRLQVRAPGISKGSVISN